MTCNQKSKHLNFKFTQERLATGTIILACKTTKFIIDLP